MEQNLPEEMLQIYPLDRQIRVMPFNVQLWFTKEIRNVTVDTAYDDNTVKSTDIGVYQFTEEKHWKYHEGQPYWYKGQNLDYWIAEFNHFLTTRGMVEFTVNYEYNDGDSWVANSYTFDLTTNPFTIPEPDQGDLMSWEV